MSISVRLQQKVSSYRPNDSARELLNSMRTVLLVGVSGAGKDTLQELLLRQFPDDFHQIVTHTTRSRRSNNGIMEQDGREYFFIDVQTAEHMLDTSGYIEANVYSDNIYGVSTAEMERTKHEGKIALGNIDVNGVASVIQLASTIKPIFILPPNYEVWQQRITKRYGQAGNADDLRRRFKTALDELLCAQDNDYFSLFINDDLTKAPQALRNMAKHPQVDRSPEALRVLEDLIKRTRESLS